MNLWLFFHTKLQLNKLDFSFDFPLGRIILHLAELYKIWKNLKNGRPKHTQFKLKISRARYDTEDPGLWS